MAKAQKRVHAKSRSEEMVRVLSSPDQDTVSGPDGVQFKISLPKPYRTCHLFDGSIATTIYLRPSWVQDRDGKEVAANKANLPR